MPRIRRDYLKELWRNRPWVYIPDVIRFMKRYPYHRRTEYFWGWLRNCLFVNWQVCWKKTEV